MANCSTSPAGMMPCAMSDASETDLHSRRAGRRGATASSWSAAASAACTRARVSPTAPVEVTLDRPRQPPPLPAAALPGGDRHHRRGLGGAGAAQRAARPGQRRGGAGRGHRLRRWTARTVQAWRPTAGRLDAVLRHADRRHRRADRLLRPRGVGHGGARPQDARRRPLVAQSHPGRLRDGRARRRPRRTSAPGSPSSWSARVRPASS